MKLINTIRAVAVTASVFTLAIGGCGKKDSAPASQDKPTKTQPAKPAKVADQPLTAAWFGKVVAPPASLAAIKAGMAVADAEKLAPGHFIDGLGLDGVSAQWQASSDGTKVGDLIVTFPAEHMPMVTAAWGPGTPATRGNDTNTVWHNPEIGIRAELSLSVDKKNTSLRFEPYLPVSELLGDGPSIAFFAKPVLGLPLAEVKQNYAAYLDGNDVVMPVGDFELSGGGSTVRFYPRDGSAPVTKYSFEIDYNSHPAFKGDLLALFEKKWGKPTPAAPPFADTSVYHAADPRVEVAVDSRGLFEITVTEK